MQTQNHECPVIVLASGQTLKALKIQLFDEQAVIEIASLRTQAAKALGTSGPMLGVGGPLNWEFAAGAVATSVLTGVLARARETQGMEALRQAQQKSDALAHEGVWFDVARISNIHAPHPQAWRARQIAQQEINVTGWARGQLRDLLQKHDRSTQSLISRNEQTFLPLSSTKSFVHNGDEFIRVGTDVGPMCIRWTHVVAYFPPEFESASSEHSHQRFKQRHAA